MSRESILIKAHELAGKAELISGKMPKSTLIVVAIEMAEFGYHQAEKDVIERAAEWIKLYVLNHDTIDIFEMEDEFKKSMMEE